MCKILNSVVQFPCIRPDDVFFLPDAHLSKHHPYGLHSSGRLSHTSRRLSVFDKLKDFFPKHRHGKTAATVRTTWLFCPDAILDKASRAEDVQPSGHQTLCCGHSSLNMEIACSWSATIRMLGQHRQDVALCRKEFQANLESRLHSFLFVCPQLPSWRRLGKIH